MGPRGAALIDKCAQLACGVDHSLGGFGQRLGGSPRHESEGQLHGGRIRGRVRPELLVRGRGAVELQRGPQLRGSFVGGSRPRRSSDGVMPQLDAGIGGSIVDSEGGAHDLFQEWVIELFAYTAGGASR